MRMNLSYLQASILRVLLAMTIFFAIGQVAFAEGPRVMLVCTPTERAIERCEAAGGQFDTMRCRCVRPQRLNQPAICGLVCIDGELDVRRCRCVRRNN